MTNICSMELRPFLYASWLGGISASYIEIMSSLNQHAKIFERFIEVRSIQILYKSSRF